MSDAQPRRRKEKRKKKESSNERSKAEAELIARRLSAGDDSDEAPATSSSTKSHSQSPQFTEGDSIIHVHHEGGTGGHWCAKIVFFFLLGVLITLIGLILIENRGIQDLDTPVAESRFAQVFDGWVDEGPIHDDHHDEDTFELKHLDEDHEEEHSDDDDMHDEIEDIESENEHDDDHDDDDHDEADDEDDHDEADDDHDEAGDDDDDADEEETNAVASQEEEDDDDQNDDDDDDDDGPNDNDDDDDDEGQDQDDDDEENNPDADDDNDDDEQADSKEVEDENVSAEAVDGDDDDDDDDDDEYINIMNPENDDDENASNERRAADIESTEDILNFSAEDDIDGFKDVAFEEVDSNEEEVIDNTAGEEEQLAARKAEKLAKEQEQSGNMGMRFTVGVALVLVTYFVLARKWRNASENDDSEISEQEIVRRMTLLPEEAQVTEDANEPEEEIEEVIKAPVVSKPVQQLFGRKEPVVHKYQEDDDEVESAIQSVKTAPIQQSVQNVETKKEEAKKVEVIKKPDEKQIEVEEGNEDEEEEEEEEIEQDESIETPAKKVTATKTETEQPDDDVEYEDEDVEDEEIVEEEDELLDEEEEEEEVEDDISDVDDAELMKKLEAKYGKLPDLDDEPEGHSDEEKPVVPARKRPKPTGGNSIVDEIEDDWNDDPNDDWKRQLDLAQAEMDEGNLEEAYRLFNAMTLTTPTCLRAKLGRAKTLDRLADVKRNNNLLDHAIEAYRGVLNMTISNNLYIEVAERLIDRIRFRGKHIDAIGIHKELINRIPNEPKYRNAFAITYLMVNKVERARAILKETLELWPNDGVALVHYGFILKTVDNNLEDGVAYLQKGIDTGESGTMEGRFVFHLGDALARLGRRDEADKVHILGAENKLFLSPQQRSLYNVDRLTGRPWWKREETPYTNFINELERNWKEIAKEANDIQSHFKPEQENLKDVGHWTQFELFVRGVEIKSHCAKCPVTCRIAKSEPAAHGCRRGQIKFSAMTPGTHVHAHTGPTNCRLRAHLGLKGTKDTYIRVHNETRSWREGKVFIFDDSFEHEVWHNGSSIRIVLIVDLWHPELTKNERVYLPAI